MAKKADAEERIEIGNATFVDNSDRDRTEIRFKDEKSQNSGVLRHKSLRGSFEPGALYALYAVKIQDPPPPPKVVAEVPTESVEELPEGSKVIDQQ